MSADKVAPIGDEELAQIKARMPHMVGSHMLHFGYLTMARILARLDAAERERDATSTDLFDAGVDLKRRLAEAERQNEALRALVIDCQRDLTEYIVPDSGISDFDVVNRLLGRLDGPQARAALAQSAEKE